MIRVFIVDDHSLMREGLKALLAKATDIEIVGEARDGATAIGLVAQSHPDVVLMDIGMPGVSGLKSAEKLMWLYDWVRVLFVSAYYDRELLEQVIETGARGYLLKTAGPQELVSAIHVVTSGERYFSPEIYGLFSEPLKAAMTHQAA